MGNEILAVRHEATKVTTILPPEYLAWSRATGWRPLSSPPETGMWVRGAWTGREVILWGDADRYDQFGAPAAVRYDPDADRWQSISEVGAPTLGEETKAVWTGMELVTQEGRYYPDRDAWEPVSDAPVADGSPFAIDRRVLFWSMSLGEAQGAVYDAESDRWGPPITTRCLDQSATGRVTAWIDRGLFVWDSRDRAWLLPSAAALGELPTDPAGCSCPSALGAE
jgi:hypothetical protein